MGISSAESAEIGLTALLAIKPTLLGTGVNVAQIEADSTNTSTNGWGYEPAPETSASKITYYGFEPSGETSTGAYTSPLPFPSYNPLYASGHATIVANIFYNGAGTVSPDVSKIGSYDAWSFWNYVVMPLNATQYSIFNQSFAYTGSSAGQLDNYNYGYDQYINKFNTVIVSAVGDGASTVTGTPAPTNQINAPATCYNGIGVGAFNGNTGIGPTYDGRCKPDITSPGGETSFSTPVVAGCCAILKQVLPDSDSRLVKALIMNGAVKTSGWKKENGSTQPLDYTMGAGVVNILNSYNLAVSPKLNVSSTSYNNTTSIENPNLGQLGWDFNTITSLSTTLATNHYAFTIPINSANNYNYQASIMLVWNVQITTNGEALNNLTLSLYNAAGVLIAQSNSLKDNVQHIYVSVPPGDYDLQVTKLAVNQVSIKETYALSVSFTPIVPVNPVLTATEIKAALATMESLNAAQINAARQAQNLVSQTISSLLLNQPVTLPTQADILAIYEANFAP